MYRQGGINVLIQDGERRRTNINEEVTASQIRTRDTVVLSDEKCEHPRIRAPHGARWGRRFFQIGISYLCEERFR